jgi:hypothetical protein
MRHGAKGRQQHKGRDKNQNRIRYAIKYTPHMDSSAKSPPRQAVRQAHGPERGRRGKPQLAMRNSI